MTEHPSEIPGSETGGEDTSPSVLDWVKSVLRFHPIPIPSEGQLDLETDQEPRREAVPATSLAERVKLEGLSPPNAAQLRLPVALLLALTAQFGFELKTGSPWIGIALYLVAGGLIGWALWAGDFSAIWLPTRRAPAEEVSFRPVYLAAALILGGFTFAASGDNRFDFPTLVFWFGSIACVTLAFWQGAPPFSGWQARLQAFVRSPRLKISLSGWQMLLAALFGIAVYFRFAQIDSLPPEMVSDHAEKLLDVVDVLNGRYSIFFPRNTGREALQFYMAAATATWLKTGISYLTLKIGTVLAGILTLPFIYLFAKEVAGRNAGLAALALSGIAYWPNVISRVGLRFPLYPLFVAPAMYLLARGVRTRSRNDFLLCGLVVGFGLHGYSPSRVIPIVIAVGVGLLLLHRETRGSRTAFISYLIVAGLAAMIVFMPLARIAVDQPDNLIYRMATRLGSTERPLPGPALQIFASNAWNALKMFGWDDGEVWVNSIPHRPALDWISSALFHLGFVIALVRYVRKRRWIDLFLIISIPILQLPSTLSLAFPGENPATNRAAGAIIPAFTLAGMAMAALPAWAEAQWSTHKLRWLGAGAGVVLFLGAARLNYDLVFVEYQDLYRRSAWNTSDAGRIIRSFAELIGDYDTAHVVGFPHWMDTRLVAMEAGRPTVDYAIWPESFPDLVFEPRAQLFLLNQEDQELLSQLQALFPTGSVTRWTSTLPGKDIVLFFVPARANGDPPLGQELDS